MSRSAEHRPSRRHVVMGALALGAAAGAPGIAQAATPTAPRAAARAALYANPLVPRRADPHIVKHTDGYYYIVYTTNWTGNTIGFARSRDRLTWTFVRIHTLPVSGLERTWAPEFFVDDGGSVNIVVSLDTASTPASIFRPHLLTATDASLSSWTTPTPLRGLDTSNYIDTFVVRHAGQYHAFTKQETTKYIEHATANSLGGPYTFRGTGDWAGWGSRREGPALVRLDNGGWRIYFDGYTEQKYYYSDSLDGFRTWTPIRELPGLTGFARHFTVLKETV
ncbi:glycoside hydrolase family 43 protein [Streptomyces sp. NPDC056697]|uniref:glycoside hydrolase family 43 protein n=1 Tax=Streptomyces sp. NPDC056697 TaxID=3345915 RepID=UPI0036BE7ED8